ncbi:GNAT family N-acetyltransferase [Luteimonas soli]|uniref:GNAT family N-acetyltransferase n=1 Tax=Luteimonas soli TaxID=1648966 RepID=A0ABV7XNJ4_9GAMM
MIAHLPHRTDRLLLRTLRVSDVDAFHGYRSREDVARLQGWSPMSREQALEFLRGEATDAPLLPGAWRQVGIAMHDDVLVGDIGIHLSADLHAAEFGLSIDPRRQARGLGTEAVQALVSLLLRHTPVATIIAATDARNLACRRMLDKAGLRKTGERTAMFKGEPCMEHVFAIERDGHR